MDQLIILRADAILAIKEAGTKIGSNDYSITAEISAVAASNYTDGGQVFKQHRENDAEYLKQFLLPLFITGIVAYALQLVLLIASIIIVVCVIKTQERKFKNIAHTTWVSAFFMVVLASVYGGFFMIIAVNQSQDTCDLMNYSERQQDVQNVTTLYNAKLAPILNTCMFSEPEGQNAAINLGIQEQTEALFQIYQASETFFEATTLMPPYDQIEKAFDDYIAQLASWGEKPSQLSFNDPTPDDPIRYQPLEQLETINQRTDLTNPDSDPKKVCQSMRDQVVELESECPNTGENILT